MINASIGYNVPLVPQTTSMSCWAAGIAMILAWRRGISIDPVTIASNPGGVSYLAQFQSGLNPNDTTILRRWGLSLEAPQSYSVEGFAQLLQRYGPLWVAASVPGPHIRVVTGFQPATPDVNSVVAINDPWEQGMHMFRWPNRGARYTRTYLQFTRDVERLARAEMNQPAPIYVAHLP
jgi:Papain-like cysteine protease AvrRpt2